MLFSVSKDERPKHELALQVVVAMAAGLAGLRGPDATAVATGMSPLAMAGLGRISKTIQSRRIEHAAETVMDGADAYGAETVEQFMDFIEAAVSDEKHQELLARSLTIAQDTAMRDKRRALGRALASAASDTGTHVDEELLFIRVLADLDASHIRALRLLSIGHLPGILDAKDSAMTPPEIGRHDPGLANSALTLLRILEQHHLVYRLDEPEARFPWDQGYVIEREGELLLERLADPEDQPGSSRGC